jgi:hypothetical protein
MITFLKEEFAPFYANYIALSNKENSIVEGLTVQLEETVLFFKSIPNTKLDFKYEVGKWTIKDILLHLIDAERIFAYRALRIARNDVTELSGFEENDYVVAANATNREMNSIIEEYISVRKATLTLYESFEQKQLLRIGNASNCSVSVRAIGYIIQGHEKHHINIIKERYL